MAFWLPAALIDNKPDNVGSPNRPKSLSTFGKEFLSHEFLGTLGEDFRPRKGPGLYYPKSDYTIPAGFRLRLQNWKYGTPVNIFGRPPDARWFWLKEPPPRLDDPLSIVNSFALPFRGTRKQSQPFACYFNVMTGFHPGEDWAGRFIVYAVADGYIIKKKMLGSNLGEYMVIQHQVISPPSTYVYSHYLHIVASIQSGWVYRGDKIGTVYVMYNKDKTKERTHLHWEMKVGPRYIGRLYTNSVQGKGYYTIRNNIYRDGYVCGSLFVNRGFIRGRHEDQANCTCDPIPANRIG